MIIRISPSQQNITHNFNLRQYGTHLLVLHLWVILYKNYYCKSVIKYKPMYCTCTTPYPSTSITLKTILTSLPSILLQLPMSPKICYVFFAQQERKCSFTATTSMYTSCMFGRSFGASWEHSNPRFSSCRIHF